MTQTPYTDYLQSNDWKDVKKKHLQAYGTTCPCGRKGQELHHWTYRRLGRERYSDLSYLCTDCHTIAHTNLNGKHTTRANDLTNNFIRAFGLRVYSLTKSKSKSPIRDNITPTKASNKKDLRIGKRILKRKKCIEREFSILSGFVTTSEAEKIVNEIVSSFFKH